MNGADLALVFLLAVCALRGFWRGFIRETFGMLALIGGVAAALAGTPAVAALVQDSLKMPMPPVMQSGVAFIGIFVLVHVTVTLVGVVLDRLAGATRGRGINRLGGAVLGIAKGAVVLAAVLLFVHLLPIAPKVDEQIMGSTVARPLMNAASNVLRLRTSGVHPESANPA